MRTMTALILSRCLLIVLVGQNTISSPVPKGAYEINEDLTLGEPWADRFADVHAEALYPAESEYLPREEASSHPAKADTGSKGSTTGSSGVAALSSAASSSGPEGGRETSVINDRIWYPRPPVPQPGDLTKFRADFEHGSDERQTEEEHGFLLLLPKPVPLLHEPVPLLAQPEPLLHEPEPPLAQPEPLLHEPRPHHPLPSHWQPGQLTNFEAFFDHAHDERETVEQYLIPPPPPLFEGEMAAPYEQGDVDRALPANPSHGQPESLALEPNAEAWRPLPRLLPPIFGNQESLLLKGKLPPGTITHYETDYNQGNHYRNDAKYERYENLPEPFCPRGVKNHPQPRSGSKRQFRPRSNNPIYPPWYGNGYGYGH